MFTGIVQAVSPIQDRRPDRLTVEDPARWPDPWEIGESVAVNGCCLTLVSSTGGLHFDLSPETWSRTAFTRLAMGHVVNLERAMAADGRFGGHWVQGHVDAVGTCVSRREEGNATVMRFSVPDPRYLVDKGSVCLDGVSLTVVRPEGNEFDVWIVPHTMEATNFGTLQPGDPVNVEYDIVARYVEKLLSLR